MNLFKHTYDLKNPIKTACIDAESCVDITETTEGRCGMIPNNEQAAANELFTTQRSCKA